VNEIPTESEGDKEADAAYRRASALDTSRPSAATRRAVLDYSARLAAERVAARTPVRRWRRPAIFGTLAAAALAGLLITPQFLKLRVPPLPPAPVADRETALPASQPAMDSVAREAQVSDAAQNAPAVPASALPPRQPVPEMRLAAQPPAARAGGGAAGTKDTQFAADEPVEPAANASAKAAAVAAAPAPAADLARRAARFAGTPNALWRAAAEGNVADLRAALAETADVDARDPLGRTALMLATLDGSPDAVDVLLAHGADPNAADARGVTPLQAAAAGGQRRIIEALQHAGAR
jgi:hypothetical protein